MKLAHALVLLSASVVSAPAAADTFQVPGDFPSIQEAVDAASDGDMVVVKRGRYAEHVVIAGFAGLTLMGKGKPIIDGEDLGTPLRITASSDVTVTGFVIERSSEHGIFLFQCLDCVVTKCRVQDTSESGIVADDSDRITISKNRLQDIGEDGIGLSDDQAVTSNDCLVEKNRILRPDDDGVDANGSGNTFQKNTVKDAGGDGFDTDSGSGNTFEKNKVFACARSGFNLDSDTNRLVRNKVIKAGHDGIEIELGGNHVERNIVVLPGENGIRLEEGDNHVERNKVVKAHEHGIRFDGANNQVEKNTVVKATHDGFHLTSAGSTLRNNKAVKSGELDLFVLLGPDSNDIDASNKFKTTNL
ncbi:MAG: hypothetical protein DRQ55_18075 [Planctomycetota bacterium]|nr:MAG: hypothetical protein DRQ55_18075 [Planctomycetota bacterium]